MPYSSRPRGAARPRGVRAWALWCALGASSAWPLAAGAQAIELEWTAPRECGPAAALERELARLLGTAHDPLTTAGIGVHAEVVHSAGRYQLQLQIAMPSATTRRQLHATRCEELVEAAAWLIALAVNPALPARAAETSAASEAGAAAAAVSTAGARSGSSRPASTSAAGAESLAPAPKVAAAPETREPPDIRAPSAAPRPRQPVPLGIHLGARAGVFAGAGADVQAALSTFLGVSADWSFTQLHASAFLPRTIDLPSPASAECWSWAFGVSECALWGRRLRGGPCAVLSGLRTSAQTRGVNGAAARQQVLWATAGPGFALSWRAWRGLALSAAGHVGIPISPRPRFSLEPLGPVISAEPWTLDAQVGVAFAYP